ncbi:MAG TPA: mechanosensitive ion channel family protein [bacterium]|nr:mechanosensitive ion channel family protein [bacterium]HPQ65528.1 mechanosensitive ion channel family protein [bacterium]
MEAWKNWLFEQGPEAVADVAYALILFGLGWLASRFVGRLVSRVLARGKLREEKLLIGLAARAARSTVVVVAAIMALEKLGVSIAPFVASLGVGSLVLGFAFKDSLSNFASGIMILVYRPFRLGDVVDIAGTMGTVEDLNIVSTKLKSFEGPVVYLPNSSVWGTKIVNYARAPFRRTVFSVGIAYGDDQFRAREVIAGVLEADARILKDPAPFVRLKELGDSSVNFDIFVYTAPGAFGDVLNDFYARLKQALEKEGFSIPFPQRDIHLFGEAPPAT